MTHQLFKDKKPHNGMTYKEYSQMFVEQVEKTNLEPLSKEEKELYDYKKLNLQRSGRIDKSYEPSEDIKNAVQLVKEKQIWMVITEPWCGDSAQNLPYLAKVAELNDNIDFRIILRDSNPGIMDLYLTNGTKSIPKLVVFDSEGNELFTWGPRPKAAHELIQKLKSEGIVKPELYEKLHLWYGRNRGKDIESEFIEIFEKVEQE